MMKWKKLVLPSAICIAAAVLVTGNMQVRAAEGTTINKGVYIGDVDVSGMTVEQAEEAVKQKVSDMEAAPLTLQAGTDTVTVTAGELGAIWKNTDVIEQAAGVGKSGNLIKRYKENKDLEKEPAKLELKYTADQAVARSYVEASCSQFEKEPEDGSLTREDGEFKIIPGVVGQKVDVEQSVNFIMDYLNHDFKGEAGTVTLAVEQEKPKGDEEELAKVQDVLGTFTTYYGSTAGRNMNVERGAELLNGHVLYPGDSFSVTDAVVPFNADNGYEMAPSYESGRVVESYGGGICQVSTTLYNALLLAELDITERSNHTMIVTYVDPSKDAAIAEGLMDLKFVNNTDAPIYMGGYAYGGELTFTLYGQETRPDDRTVSYESEVLKTINPEGVALYAKTDANIGYLQQFQSSHTGMEARLWKVVTQNGETERTQINSSYYQAAAVGYEVGTASPNPDTSVAMNNAIAANDLASVQSIIAGGGAVPPGGTPQTDPTQTPESDTQQSETTPTPPDPNTPPADPNTPPADPNTPPADPNTPPADPNTPPVDPNAPPNDAITPPGGDAGGVPNVGDVPNPG